MVQSPTGLFAPLSRSHFRSSFGFTIDIAFHLLHPAAFYRLFSTRVPQRWTHAG
jgi:hypothetical protein